LNIPNIFKIKKIIHETNNIKTFIFNCDIGENPIIPGQFIMVWNFKDEKPMSISIINEKSNEIGITVKNVGKFTNNLHNLNVGDKLGLRGPYGNGFDVSKEEKILAIGGGVGMAPIRCFTDLTIKKHKNIDVLCAATTKDELLFYNDLKQKKINVFPATDDGTYGFKGYAINLVKDLVEKNTYQMAVVCGPEQMMIGIFNLLEQHEIPAQYSLERYMKCAVGLCGQCCVDNIGWRVCIEGPVFNSKNLKSIEEFGKYHRDASGVKQFYL